MMILTAATLAAPAPSPAQDAPLPSVLTADQAVDAALAARPDLASRRAQAEVAHTRPSQAGALPDPMVMAGLDKYTVDGMGRDWMFTVQQSFPLSGVLGRRADAARATAREADAQTAVTEQDIALAARLAYIDAWETERVVETAKTALSLAASAADTALARYRAGAAGQGEMLRAQTERESARATLDVANENRRAARVALFAALGWNPDAPEAETVQLAGIQEPLAAPDLEALRAKAESDRPELDAAERSIEAAQADVRAAKAQYWPTGQVLLGYMDSNMETDSYRAMVGISIPLGLGWRGDALDGARAEERVGRSNRAAARLAIERDLSVAHAQLRAAIAAREALARQILPRAEAAQEASFGAYASGREPLTSLIDALSALNNARLGLEKARADAARRQAILERAAGTILINNPGGTGAE